MAPHSLLVSSLAYFVRKEQQSSNDILGWGYDFKQGLSIKIKCFWAQLSCDLMKKPHEFCKLALSPCRKNGTFKNKHFLLRSTNIQNVQCTQNISKGLVFRTVHALIPIGMSHFITTRQSLYNLSHNRTRPPPSILYLHLCRKRL